MTIGTSLFLITVGAILRYAVEDSVNGIDIPTVGLILMLVGAVGLAIGIYFAFIRRDPAAAPAADDPRYADRPPPPPRY